MRTFTFTDGKSNKFWNIELQGSRFTVTFGKVGSKGQSQTKEFADAQAAQKEAARLIAEKLRKGYQETTPAAASSEWKTAESEPKSPAAAGSDSVRAALEAAVLANPDDRLAHSAYADYLQEQGDPRGEFISVQLALEDTGEPPRLLRRVGWGRDVGAFIPADASRPPRSLQLGSPAHVDYFRKCSDLLEREQKLLLDHQREWLGPALVDHLLEAGAELTFRRGHPWGLQLDRNCEDRLEELGERSLAVLVYPPFTRWLRRLHVGDSEQYTRAYGPGLAALVAACPALQELDVFAHISAEEAAQLFAAPLPALRQLTLCCTEHYPLDVLASNPTLTRLRTLLFFPHRQWHDDPPYLNAAGLRTLGASKHLESLADLTFKMWDGGDAAAEALVETGLVLRLERLDLSIGNLSDAGAGVLARALASSPHRLRQLDVTRNGLTEAGLATLRGTGVGIQSHGQHAPEDPNYLCADGDIE
jgi:uncharacterized protein (TIGR02996 family)